VAEARQRVATRFEFYNHQWLHKVLDYSATRHVFEEALRLKLGARKKQRRERSGTGTARCKPGLTPNLGRPRPHRLGPPEMSAADETNCLH